MATAQITVKMPEQTLRRLDWLANQSNASRNELVVLALDRMLSARNGSAADRMGALIGAVDAPEDGSTSEAWRERISHD